MSWNMQQSIEAEQALLGSILFEPQVLDNVAHLLDSRDFSIQSHELVWTAMKHLYEHDKPVDVVTITDMLMTYKRLDEIGGVSYLMDLTNAVPTSAHAEYYARLVRTRAYRRRGADVGERIKKIALEEKFEDDETFFATVEKLADSIRPQVSGGLKHMQETKTDYLDYLMQKDDLIQTGFRRFDEWMGGIGRGWLYILAARPSVGKTAKMLQMVRGMAQQEKGEILVWSQEMKREALFNRMIASMTGISANKIRRKTFSDRDLEDITEAYDQLAKLLIHIADSKKVTIEEVRAIARQTKRRRGRIGAIFVDYLTIMDIPQTAGMTRAQAIGEVTKKAKQIAMEIDCPFIMLAQLNRESKKSLKPGLEHLKESGDIEQDADIVEFLWEDPDDIDVGKHFGAKVIQSIIAKGRDIGVNEFRYAFKGWTQEFIEL